MNFLLPAFLGAAALAGVPLLLHLLRLQPRKPIAFPSLQFLGRAALRDSNRQQFRRWLTLLLRCLAIGLIVAAFCRPFWPLEHATDHRAVVVLVDNSYSMQAAGRREAVAKWLRPQLDALRRPDRIGVLLMHPAPTWLVPLGEDFEAARRLLETLPSAYETSQYRPALEVAGAALGLAPAARREIWIAGDHQRLGWNGVRFDRPLPPGIKLHVPPPAEAPPRQAALLGLAARRLADNRIALDATIRSWTVEPDERAITYFAGGEKLGTQRVILTAGRMTTVHAEFAVADPDAAVMLHATIDHDDLAVDDTAYAALPPADDRRVLLSGARRGDVDYLSVALRSVRGEKLSPVRIEPLPAAGPWAPSAVAVLRGPNAFREPAVSALNQFLDAGGAAWLWCDGSAEQMSWLGARGVALTSRRPESGRKLQWRDLALEHPLFAPFARHSLSALLSAGFERGWAIEGAAVEPLARWRDRSIALAELPVGSGRVLLAGFSDGRTESNFPLTSAYVPFVHQAVTWLAQSQLTVPLGGKVGAPIVLPGAGTWRAVMTPRAVAPSEVNGYVTASIPGLYAFEQPNAPRRFYAVNLDNAESDLTAWPATADFARLVQPAPERPTIASPQDKAARHATVDENLVDERQMWWWLLVAAFGVLLAELLLANRTVP